MFLCSTSTQARGGCVNIYFFTISLVLYQVQFLYSHNQIIATKCENVPKCHSITASVCLEMVIPSENRLSCRRISGMKSIFVELWFRKPFDFRFLRTHLISQKLNPHSKRISTCRHFVLFYHYEYWCRFRRRSVNLETPFCSWHIRVKPALSIHLNNIILYQVL